MALIYNAQYSYPQVIPLTFKSYPQSYPQSYTQAVEIDRFFANPAKV